jgi:hypothetical protein
MRSIAKQRRFAPVMNDCRITPAAYPTYPTCETTVLRGFAPLWFAPVCRAGIGRFCRVQ